MAGEDLGHSESLKDLLKVKQSAGNNLNLEPQSVP